MTVSEMPMMIPRQTALWAADLRGASQNSELIAWLFAAVFVLLGVLLAVQVSRWLVRRSPRTRSFQLVAEAAGDAVFEMDLDSRLVWCKNPTGLGIEGIQTNADMQIGTQFDGVHPEDREELDSGWDRLAAGEHLDLHVRLRAKDGRWVWVHINAVPGQCRGLRRARAYGVIRHTHDLHERQANLAEARRLETVGTMAGGVAHEFNNHLTPVRGYLELALDDLPAGTPTHEGLKTALERVIHCSELVAQVQSYGRRSLMFPEPMDLTRLLVEVPALFDSLRANLGRRATLVRLINDWPKHLPEVKVDRDQFHKALEHLIRNAFEAMPHGGELWIEANTVEIRDGECSAIPEATPGTRVMVRITDTGGGIPEALLNQVADPFFTTHGRARSRGMGLPMVQGMMAQLGGWMQIRSIEGLGTTIELLFPVLASDASRADGAEENHTTGVIPIAETGRMLIADDEPCVRDLARTIFESEHWMVEEASNFNEVIARCTDPSRPELDLVLLDLVMPGPSAEEAIRVIRTTVPGYLILLMSGCPRTARIDAMLEEAGLDYIGKPFSTAGLLQKVDEMARGRKVAARANT